MAVTFILHHILTDSKTGRLSYLRAFPAALLPFIPVGTSGKTPAVLKVSLATKDPAGPEFHARYAAAAARYDTIVVTARKLATGTYDRLDAPQIAYLGQVFEAEWLARHETSRWAGGPERAAMIKAGWDHMLPDLQQWRGTADLDAIEDKWTEAATALLLAQGHALDPTDHDGFRTLCRELNDTALRVSEVSLALLAGVTVAPQFVAPTRPMRGRDAPGCALSLLGLYDGYAAARLKPLAAQDGRRSIIALIAFLKHDDAARLSTDDLLRWRDKLLEERSDKGELRQAGTVRNNYIGPVKAALNWAVTERKLVSNPALGVTVWVGKKVKLRDRELTSAEATMILQAALAPIDPAIAITNNRARRWVPWLLAYTGARVNELTQLRGGDVAEREGVWTINITPEAGTVKSAEARIVPIHSHLIEQGFLSFVESVGAGPLFYDPERQRVKSATNRHVKKVGERLAEWVRRDVGITDTGVSPNHGWRHRWKTQALAAGMPERVADAIQGHAATSVSKAYGSVSIVSRAQGMELLPRYLLPPM